MATAEDIATQALRQIAILRLGGTPSATQSGEALSVLNNMINAWYADGVQIDLSQPLPVRHEEGIVALLALKLAPGYGEAAIVSQSLAKTARDGWERLLAEYVFAPRAGIDRAVTTMPSQRLVGQRGVPFNIAGSIPSSVPSVTGFCTLLAGSPQTVIQTNATFGLSATVALTPHTAAAQDEWDIRQPTAVAGPLVGQFTVTHMNNAIIDRQFEYLITI